MSIVRILYAYSDIEVISFSEDVLKNEEGYFYSIVSGENVEEFKKLPKNQRVGYILNRVPDSLREAYLSYMQILASFDMLIGNGRRTVESLKLFVDNETGKTLIPPLEYTDSVINTGKNGFLGSSVYHPHQLAILGGNPILFDVEKVYKALYPYVFSTNEWEHEKAMWVLNQLYSHTEYHKTIFRY